MADMCCRTVVAGADVHRDNAVVKGIDQAVDMFLGGNHPWLM